MTNFNHDEHRNPGERRHHKGRKHHSHYNHELENSRKHDNHFGGGSYAPLREKLDLASIFKNWVVESNGQRSPRLLKGEEGLIVQIPVPNGLLQFNVEGEPLDWLKKAVAGPETLARIHQYKSGPGTIETLLPFLMRPESKQKATQEIEQEICAWQKRGQACVGLGLWDQAERDSAYCIKIFKILFRFSEENNYSTILASKVLESMLANTRARASKFLEAGETKMMDLVLKRCVAESEDWLLFVGKQTAKEYREKFSEIQQEFRERSSQRTETNSSGPEVKKGIDLSLVLRIWRIMDGAATVRTIKGSDQREKIQRSTEYGLTEFYADEHPRNVLRMGYEKLTDTFRKSHFLDGAEVCLSREDCRKIDDDVLLYRERSVCFSSLRDWQRTIRDLSTCYDYLRFIADCADDEKDKKSALEDLPEYSIEITKTKIKAALSVANYTKAWEMLQDGYKALATLKAESDDFHFQEEITRTTKNLVSQEEEVLMAMPSTSPLRRKIHLEQRLRVVLAAENYESAAEIHREIKQLSAELEGREAHP